jgi:LPXTG-motif cell wall-anchored protein
MSKTSVTGIAVAAFVAMMTTAPVYAVTYEKLAYLTFSAPVQVPGVTLRAGTYAFRLANPATSRNVLQVLSNDGMTVHAMFFTIPDSRTTITPDPFVSFRETPAGVPPAVHALFYGGEYRGYAFVYPKGGPVMTAEVRPQPPITYTPIPAAKPAPVTEPEITVATEPLEFEQAPAATPLPREELPKTATPLPLIATAGLTSLLVGLGLGVLRRRYN